MDNLTPEQKNKVVEITTTKETLKKTSVQTLENQIIDVQQHIENQQAILSKLQTEKELAETEAVK